MKTPILIFFFLSSFAVKADTITTWNVFYNSKLLKQFSDIRGVREINIKLSEYKSGDFLAIKYGDDTPCSDCNYELSIITDAKWEVYRLDTKHKYELMKIDLKNIITDFKSSSQRFYVVYFTQIDRNGKRDSGRRLFVIKIS